MGKRGPPRTPTAIKLAYAAPSARNLRDSEPEPPPMCEVPTAPAHLGKIARAEWARVCPIMIEIGLLTELDLTVLAVYCDTFERWRVASDIMAQLAIDDPVTRGVVVRSKAGSVYENPVEAMRRGLARDLVRYAQMLGLSPSGRSSVSIEHGGFGPRTKRADELARKYGL